MTYLILSSLDLKFGAVSQFNLLLYQAKSERLLAASLPTGAVSTY
jgi:hypothetical protein